MQRQRSGLHLFPDAIDLNHQGSPPNNAPNTDNNHPHSSWCESTINQVETRFPNYTRATNQDPSFNPFTTSGNNSAPSFSGSHRGESSSTGFNPRDESRCEMPKFRPGCWPPSSSSYSPSPPSENWSFEPLDMSTNSTGLYHGPVGPTSQSYYGSSSIPRSHGHVRESDSSQRQVLGHFLPHSTYKPTHQENEPIPNFYASSSSNLVEHNDASGSAFAAWGGPSWKRKAAEGGTSAGSSSNQLTGKNVMQHHGNLMISSGPLNPSSINQQEQRNDNPGFGALPPPARNFNSRSNLGQEAVPHDAQAISSYRGFGVNLVQENSSRPVSTSLQIDLVSSSHRAPNSSFSPWNNGSLSSQRGDSLLSSHLFEDEANRARSSSRGNNVRCSPANVSLPHQIDWSFEPETSSDAARAPSSPSSSSWLPHHHHHQQHQASQNNHHQRFSEAAPWIQYPRNESEAGNNSSRSSSISRRNHLGLIPSVSASSNEVGSSSRARHLQLNQRSAAALLMDLSGDDVSGWHAIAAAEERHRLIRQLLNAMRRGVQLQAEDYMVFDPYMDEVAELHDRHRDMRLDVDNMSYEELLALEEQIGNVSTGLSEEKIMQSIKQRRLDAMELTTQNSEPCCICQEEYVAGDAVAVLDCAHEFHTSCIKQWLTQKNLCPICKMAALET